MNEPKLPEQLQRQINEAEQIEREIAAMLNPEPATPEEPEAADPQEAPADTQDTPVAPEPVSEPAVETAEEPWQSRYLALKGKYDAEVPRYAQQLREQSQYIQQLESRLREPPTQEPARTDEGDKEAIELFGEDLVKFTRKMAQAEADRRIAELKQSQQVVEQRMAQSEHERFFSQVDQAVPGWRDMDTDPAWLGWLQEYDPLLGAPRQAALEQAATAHDVARVAYLFNTFRGTRAPAPSSAPAPAQMTRSQLEQVTPRASGNASVAPTSTQKIYTQEEIKVLLDPRRMYRLPLEQQKAIERDIDLAVAEGRIAA